MIRLRTVQASKSILKTIGYFFMYHQIFRAILILKMPGNTPDSCTGHQKYEKSVGICLSLRVEVYYFLSRMNVTGITCKVQMSLGFTSRGGSCFDCWALHQ